MMNGVRKDFLKFQRNHSVEAKEGQLNKTYK